MPTFKDKRMVGEPDSSNTLDGIDYEKTGASDDIEDVMTPGHINTKGSETEMPVDASE